MNITVKVPDGYALTANVADKPYALSPDKLTNDALLHVLEYGFQRIINDKTGGKNKTLEEKEKKATEMLARLSAEQYQRRRVGTVVDPMTAEIRAVLRDLIKHPRFKTQLAEYKAFAESADREAYLDDWFDTMPEELAAKMTEIATGKLKEKEKAAKQHATLIETLAASVAETPAKKKTAKK